MESLTPAQVQTAPELLRDRAEAFGGDDVLVTPNDRLSYRALDDRSFELARRFVAAGVGKGSRVGILLPNGPEWLVSWFAVARVGATAVLLNTYQTPTELRWVLRHADVQLVVLTPQLGRHDLAATLESAAAELATAGDGPLYLPSLPALRSVWSWREDPRRWLEDLREQSPGACDEQVLRALEASVVPSDPVTVIYTSGSTAAPKGVIHTQGALVRHARRLRLHLRDLEPRDRVFSPMPFFWVGGLAVHGLGTMHVGGAILCQDLFDPATALELLERERATVVFGWSHARQALAQEPSFPTRDLRALRTPLRPEPGREAVSHPSLGMTETCGPHVGTAVGEQLPEHLRSSFGFPIAGVEHRVVDPVTGEPRPEGIEGEICVRGEDVSIGRVGEERSATFDADGWYRTGDLGYLRDGALFFTGRAADLIKANGMNVSAAEVETALVALPEIAQAVVVGVEGPGGEPQVVAAVVPSDGATIDGEVVRTMLREVLSSYKVPRAVVVVDHGALPLLHSGKVDRRAVARLVTTATIV